MSYFRLLVVLASASVMLAQTEAPKPSISVVHSATRIVPRNDETGLAPNSLCDIDLSSLYPPFGTLPRDEKVTLRFRAASATTATDLKILSTSQIGVLFTALIPEGTPVGQGEVIGVGSSGATFSTPVWISATNVGLFTRGGVGFDAALAQVLRGTPQLVGLTNPVHAGEWVTLWGTGMGVASGGSTVSVEVAGIPVTPAYAGRAPGLPGVDQINFLFPEGVPDDCYIPIAVKEAGRAGNTPSIATSSTPGACRHRLGLSTASLAQLDQGGSILLSQTWVHGDVVADPANPAQYRRADTVSLEFTQYGAALVQAFTGLLTTPAAGCQRNSSGGTVAAVLSRSYDAGTPVVTGPAGVRIPMQGSFGRYSTPPSDATYPLSAVPPFPFAPGDWAVQVPGGADIAAFQAPLRIPPPLRWTNRATVSPVSRTSDLTLKWDPAGYTDREWMQGSVGVGMDAVLCQAPATAGSITIPAALIGQLPAASAGLSPMVQLLLTPRRSDPVLYLVPQTSGGPIPGLATFSYLEVVLAELR